jgi:hypothetical protein
MLRRKGEVCFLTSPVRYIGDEEIGQGEPEMELSDRTSQEEDEGCCRLKFQLDADILIVAVGNLINPFPIDPDIEVSRCGNIIVNLTEKTSKKGYLQAVII